MGLSALQKFEAKWKEKKFVCIGLDNPVFSFNKKIIDSTFDYVCAYKPQISFYEAKGLEGWKALKKTVSYIKKNHPSIPIILDAKRADIGSTNEGYVKAYFDELGVDGVTVHPYLGQEALKPFLERKDKLIIVLVRTSNSGAGEFQDLKTGGKPLYRVVASQVAKKWNENKNCAVVVGATYPKELKEIRKIIKDMPILIPGVGAQGGDVKEAVKNGLNSKGGGIIISSSRAIIYAKSPRIATIALHKEIQEALKHV